MHGFPFSLSLSPLMKALLLEITWKNFLIMPKSCCNWTSIPTLDKQHILLAEQDPLPEAAQSLCVPVALRPLCLRQRQADRLRCSALTIFVPFKNVSFVHPGLYSIVTSALNALFIAYPLAYSCPWKRPWQLETSLQLWLAGASFWSGIWLHN